jgi:(p)ppGpp synthase/HD superfamily hydrolase
MRPRPSADTVRIASAANLANRAHAGTNQVRKGTGLPYIIHPARVAVLVEEAGGTADQIAAAWAHDVLEDCPGHRDEARYTLAPEVYALVRELTKAEISPGKRVKGEAFLAELRAMSPAAKLIKLCDRLDNLRDVARANQPDWAAAYARESIEVLAALTSANPASGPAAERLVAAIREQIRLLLGETVAAGGLG